MTKRNFCLVLFFLAPPWAVFILACYWFFIDNEVPVHHTSVSMTNIAGKPIASIKRGETIVLARDSCVLDEGKAYYSRRLIMRNKRTIYFMPSGDVQLIKGCSIRFNHIIIPTYVEPGLYDYVVTVVFENNPIVSTTTVLPIISFEVLP
jgi:hypothetical protein